MKIFIDDDDDDGDDDDGDDDDDDDDDDDVVERTPTGPSAVSSDLEHQEEEGGPTGAVKTRCFAVNLPCLKQVIHYQPWIYRSNITIFSK